MREKTTAMHYVIGHKNPDTDSICAALAYADLKKQLGYKAQAMRLGPMNEETKYAIKYFDVEGPLLMKDARTLIGELDMDYPSLLSEKACVNDAWETIPSSKNRSIIIVDEKGMMKGIVSTGNLAKLRYLPLSQKEEYMRDVRLDSLCKTIQGKNITSLETLHSNGRVLLLSSLKEEAKIKDSICILTDDIQDVSSLIEQGAAALIMQSTTPITEALKTQHKCVILVTDMHPFLLSQVIFEAISLHHIMTTDPIYYYEEDYAEEVAAKMKQTRFRSYPVLNKKQEVVGAISRYHLFHYEKKKLILVDHSSRKQSVNYIEQADIEEVIDHHHIGDIETNRPIYYRNQQCGATCSIIYQLYKENGIVPDKKISGLLLSAIISDTLCFRSQTTTEKDIENAKELALMADVSLEKYAEELLNASANLKNADAEVILKRDLKRYTFGEHQIAVGQTNYKNIEDIQSRLGEFKTMLQKYRDEQSLDLIVMMFTHVLGEGSMFLYFGTLSYLMECSIETVFDECSGFDSDIMSRKQQLIPIITQLLNQ